MFHNADFIMPKRNKKLCETASSLRSSQWQRLNAIHSHSHMHLHPIIARRQLTKQSLFL